MLSYMPVYWPLWHLLCFLSFFLKRAGTPPTSTSTQREQGWIFFFYFLKFIHLWLCWVFVSVRGSSLVVAGGGHSYIMVRGPVTIAASLVAEHRLSNCGSWAQLLRGTWESSQTRARTRVPCIGRQILNHCATREALCFLLKNSFIGSMFTIWITLFR